MGARVRAWVLPVGTGPSAAVRILHPSLRRSNKCSCCRLERVGPCAPTLTCSQSQPSRPRRLQSRAGSHLAMRRPEPPGRTCDAYHVRACVREDMAFICWHLLMVLCVSRQCQFEWRAHIGSRLMSVLIGTSVRVERPSTPLPPPPPPPPRLLVPSPLAVAWA